MGDKFTKVAKPPNPRRGNYFAMDLASSGETYWRGKAYQAPKGRHTSAMGAFIEAKPVNQAPKGRHTSAMGAFHRGEARQSSPKGAAYISDGSIPSRRSPSTKPQRGGIHQRWEHSIEVKPVNQAPKGRHTSAMVAFHRGEARQPSPKGATYISDGSIPSRRSPSTKPQRGDIHQRW